LKIEREGGCRRRRPWRLVRVDRRSVSVADVEDWPIKRSRVAISLLATVGAD